METKCNLFAIVSKETNTAVAIVDSVLSLYFKSNFKVFDILPVRSTGVTSHSTDKGIITSISIWIDSNEHSVYYIITNWPNKISIGEAYKEICD